MNDLARFLRSFRKDPVEGEATAPQILLMLVKFCLGASVFVVPIVLLLHTETGRSYSAQHRALGFVSTLLDRGPTAAMKSIR